MWPAIHQALRVRGGLRRRDGGGVTVRRAVIGLLVVAAGVMLGDRGRDVGHRQQGEDERLDEPEEELQAKEDGGDEERRQRELEDEMMSAMSSIGSSRALCIRVGTIVPRRVIHSAAASISTVVRSAPTMLLVTVSGPS